MEGKNVLPHVKQAVAAYGGRRSPNASLILLAGGTFSDTVEKWYTRTLFLILCQYM